MKLHYFQRKDGQLNFGDDLNAWLWEKIFPGFFQNDSDTTFVGMGTLINNRLPERLGQPKNVLIFSTGAGYEEQLKIIPQEWKIYCVRGPLSAKILGIPSHLGIADGAILTRKFYQPQATKVYQYSFMPHVSNAILGGELFRKTCQDLGFGYIDPRGSTEKVLESISQTEILLAEAMHGAIIADTLRIPWIPLTTSPKILSFKWNDWCQSVGVPYKPRYLSPLRRIYPRLMTKHMASRRTRRYWQLTARSLNHWQKSILQNPNSLLQIFSGESRIYFQTQLLNITKTATPILSSDIILERLTSLLEEKVEQLKSDWI